MVYFFQSGTIQEMQAKKYKNTFHEQLIDQNKHSRNSFFYKKIGSYSEIESIFVILHNNSIEHCFTSLDLQKMEINNMFKKYFI